MSKIEDLGAPITIEGYLIKDEDFQPLKYKDGSPAEIKISDESQAKTFLHYCKNAKPRDVIEGMSGGLGSVSDPRYIECAIPIGFYLTHFNYKDNCYIDNDTQLDSLLKSIYVEVIKWKELGAEYVVISGIDLKYHENEFELGFLAETNIVTFDVSFEIITWKSGKFGVSGHIAIDDVVTHFPEYDNDAADAEYETKQEAELAAQRHYFTKLISFVSNNTLSDEENVRPLQFINGGVAFEIEMYVVPHLNNFKITGQLKREEGFGEYLTLDQFDSIELGYREYNSPSAAEEAANDFLKHVIANNLIFSCNKCTHLINHRICNNKASKFYCNCMDCIDDGCNSFQAMQDKNLPV